jgi:hypothetical protein
MLRGKGKGCSLLANEKQYKAMTINRKMRIQNKMSHLRKKQTYAWEEATQNAR